MTPRRPAPRKPRTRSWRLIANDVASELVQKIAALPPNELRVLARAGKRLTQTNCWFVVYQLMPTMVDLAKRHRRATERRKARGGSRG